MQLSLRAVALAALGLTCLWSQEPTAIRLWAAGDGVRVSPVTGKLIEGRPDIHKDYPATDPRAGSLVWAPATKTVSLKCARNEFCAFQVVIEGSGAQEIDVKFPALAHPSGARLEGRNIAIFKEWYTQVRRASSGYDKISLGPDWYPDALMPYRRSGLSTGFPFSIPDLHNNIAGQTNHAVWIDVYVPYERQPAPPGRYTGNLEVTWKGGKDSLRVALDVWDFALPQETHLRGDIWNDSMKTMPPDEELAYYQLARQHRFLPLVYGYRPKLSVKGTSVEINWTDYDQRLTRYLDGSAFTEKYGYWGPGTGVPVDHMMLPFDCERQGRRSGAWPMALPAAGRTPEYEAVWKETARQIRAHLDRDPNWRKVTKIAFLNGLDESYNEESYEKMLYYGKLLHDGLGRGWFKYRVDGGYSREAMEKLRREVELWVGHTADWDYETVEHFRTRGVDSWFYGPMIYEQKRNSENGSNTFIDLDLLVNRGIGWVAWKYRSGWVEWEFDHNAYAAWYESENYKDPGRTFNGSGQSIYRGVVMGYRQPIPSIRLKAQRRGLQDYEYMWLLEQKTKSKDASDRLVNGIVYKRPFGNGAMLDTEIWKNNPADWDKAREAAGDMIARK